MNYDLDLRELIVGQSHDTSLGHRQQLHEIGSKSNMTKEVKARALIYLFVNCDLDLANMTVGQGLITHLLVMDNHCVQTW